jgi:hypothetical protein
MLETRTNVSNRDHATSNRRSVAVPSDLPPHQAKQRGAAAGDDGICPLDHCLDDLSHLDREVVISYFLVQSAREQAAKRIDLDPGEMSKRLRRALSTLKRKLLMRGLVVPGMLTTFFAELNAQSRIPARLAQQLATIDPVAAHGATVDKSRSRMATGSSVKRVALSVLRWCGRGITRPLGRRTAVRNVGPEHIRPDAKESANTEGVA